MAGARSRNFNAAFRGIGGNGSFLAFRESTLFSAKALRFHSSLPDDCSPEKNAPAVRQRPQGLGNGPIIPTQ